MDKYLKIIINLQQKVVQTYYCTIFSCTNFFLSYYHQQPLDFFIYACYIIYVTNLQKQWMRRILCQEATKKNFFSEDIITFYHKRLHLEFSKKWKNLCKMKPFSLFFLFTFSFIGKWWLKFLCKLIRYQIEMYYLGTKWLLKVKEKKGFL